MAIPHHEVIHRFRNGLEKNGRRLSGQGTNMSTDGERLYSYRACIATKVQCKGETLVLHNGDRMSSTTSGHQSAARHSNEPTTSFSCLEGPDLMERSSGLWSARGRLVPGVELLDYTCDRNEYIDTQGDVSFLPGVVRLEDTVRKYKTWGRPDTEYSYHIHRPGSLLLRRTQKATRVNDLEFYQARPEDNFSSLWPCAKTVMVPCREYYLAAMDEGSYFVSRLPRPVKTVQEAFNVLVPKEVLQVQEARGKIGSLEEAGVIRQGEWFFIPRPDVKYREFDKAAKAQVSRHVQEGNDGGDVWRVALPRTTDSSNPHSCTRLLRRGKELLVAGTVRHPQHHTVRLEKGLVYQAVKNTSKGDWSARGKVD